MCSEIYKQCSYCVMDTTDPDISFNEKGECNHCNKYRSNSFNWAYDQAKKTELETIINKIKKDGKHLSYDCIIGVSGGVDSTYVAYIVKKLGLRPLAVHLDNGWNSELAVTNIEKTLNTLDIDLYTHVLNWEEFKELQISFLKASIPGMEIPTDHAIWAILQLIAAKNNIKYIINGYNLATEYIMPKKWSEGDGQLDWLLIRNIQKQFGIRKLKFFPHVGLWQQIYIKLLKKVRTINILDFIQYSKKEAMRVLQDDLGWVYYGGKHYESIYTRFTQGYIQPKKFNIDKRKAHFSNLICLGEITREFALQELKKSPYPSDEMLEKDKDFFQAKLNLSAQEFDSIMKATAFSYLDYRGYFNHPIFSKIYNLALRIHSFLKTIKFYGGARGGDYV